MLRSRRGPYDGTEYLKKLRMPGMRLGKLPRRLESLHRLTISPSLISLCGNAQAGPSRRRLDGSTNPPSLAKRRRISSNSRSASPGRPSMSDDDEIQLAESVAFHARHGDGELTEQGRVTYTPPFSALLTSRRWTVSFVSSLHADS